MANRQHKSISVQKAVLTLLSAASTDWMVKHGAPAPPPALSTEQKQSIKDAFDMLDADGSGEVGVEELMEAYALIDVPMTRVQAQALMEEVDADGSGQMEFEEFKVLMVKAMVKPTEVGVSEPGTVPISDMALAFRRKKMLEAAITGGQGRDKLARLYDPSKEIKLLPKLPNSATAGGGKHAAAKRIACMANAVLTISRQTSQEAQQLRQMLGSLSRHGSLTPSPAGSKRSSLDLHSSQGHASHGGHTPSRQSLEAATARAFGSGGCGTLPLLGGCGYGTSSPGDLNPSAALNPTFVRVPEGGWRASGNLDGGSWPMAGRVSAASGNMSPSGGLVGDSGVCSSPKAYGVHSSLLTIASAKAARAVMDGRASGSSGGVFVPLLQVPHSGSGLNSPTAALSPLPHAATSTLFSSGHFSSPGSYGACGSPMALNPASCSHTALNPGSCLSPGGHAGRPGLSATLKLCKSMRSVSAFETGDADAIQEEEEDDEEESDVEDDGARKHSQFALQSVPPKQQASTSNGQSAQPTTTAYISNLLHIPGNSGSNSVKPPTSCSASSSSKGSGVAKLGTYSATASSANTTKQQGSSTNTSSSASNSSAGNIVMNNNASSSNGAIRSPSSSGVNASVQLAFHSSLYGSSSSGSSLSSAPPAIQCPSPTFAAIKAATASPANMRRSSSSDAPARNSLTSIGITGAAASPRTKIPGSGSSSSCSGRPRSNEVSKNGAALPNIGPFSDAMCG